MGCIDAVSVPCDSGDVFHCNDDKGRCIPLSMKCDGNEWQCPRNTDEKDCSKYIYRVEYYKDTIKCLHIVLGKISMLRLSS
jgi:hypothetical protein